MEKSKWELEETYKDDLTRKEIEHAFSCISFDPERRATDRLREWPPYMASLYQDLKEEAEKGGMLDALPAEFERFHGKYVSLMHGYYSSMSREVSSMIAGPSKFPTDRMRKRASWTHNKSEAMEDYKKRAFAAIKRILRPDLAPVRIEDGNAVERLDDKAQALISRHAALKTLAAFCHKNTDTKARAAEIIRLKIDTKGEDRFYLTPDFGVESYALSNLSTKIRAAKSRVKTVEYKKGQEAKEIKTEAGIKYAESPAENRVRVFFPGKPAPEVIKELKSSGFRWTPSLGCWQAYHNSISIVRAKRFAGIEEQADAKSL
jgi:hypothetical protein